MSFTLEKTIFILTVVGTTSSLVLYGNWVAKVSKAGKQHSRVLRAAWTLTAIFAALLAFGAWELFMLHKPLGFVNWTLLVCGAVGLLIVPATYRIARRSYRESELRNVIAHDI